MIRGIAVAEATVHWAKSGRKWREMLHSSLWTSVEPLKQMGRFKLAFWQDLSGRPVRKGLEDSEKGREEEGEICRRRCPDGC